MFTSAPSVLWKFFEAENNQFCPCKPSRNGNSSALFIFPHMWKHHKFEMENSLCPSRWVENDTFYHIRSLFRFARVHTMCQDRENVMQIFRPVAFSTRANLWTRWTMNRLWLMEPSCGGELNRDAVRRSGWRWSKRYIIHIRHHPFRVWTMKCELFAIIQNYYAHV